MRSEDKNLRHQLDRLREEHSVLTTSAVAEEQVATLTKELEVSRRKETSPERSW